MTCYHWSNNLYKYPPFTRRRRWMLGWPAITGAITYINILHLFVGEGECWNDLLSLERCPQNFLHLLPPDCPQWLHVQLEICLSASWLWGSRVLIPLSYPDVNIPLFSLAVLSLLLSDDPICKLCRTCVTHPFVWLLSNNPAPVLISFWIVY